MGDAARISPGALTLCATANALRDWATAAMPGDVVVYAVGADAPRSEAGFTAARALCDAGRVELFSRRRDDGRKEWCARATAPTARSASDDWTLEARLLALVHRHGGALRATNEQLATMLNLRNRDRAAALIRKLKAARVIATFHEVDGRRVIARFGAI